MAATVLFVNCVTQRNPLTVRCTDSVNGEVELTSPSHMTLFLCLGNRPCHPGTLRYHDLIADFDGFSNRKFDSLALLGGARRDGLIETHAQLGSIGNIDLSGRDNGRHED